MTYIKPNKNKTIFDTLVPLLIVGVLVSVAILIFFYNHNVAMQHEITRIHKDISLLESEAAQLREDVFAVFDAEHVKTVAQERGLVVERNPEYIEIGKQWASASQ